MSTDVGLTSQFRAAPSLSLSLQSKYSNGQHQQASFVNNELFNTSGGAQYSDGPNVLSTNFSFMQSMLVSNVAGKNTSAMGQWQKSLDKRHRLSMFGQLAQLRNAPASASRDANQVNGGLSFSVDPASAGGWQKNITVMAGKAMVTHSGSPYGNLYAGLIGSVAQQTKWFVPEGVQVTPWYVAISPYNSVTDNNGFKHQVDSISTGRAGSSYYQINVALNTQYVISVNQMSDNVDLFVYSDSGYTNLLCSSQTVSLQDELCAANSGGNSIFYVKVNYVGVSEGSLYRMQISPDYYLLGVDAGTGVLYLENQILDLSHVQAKAYWDNTASPSMLPESCFPTAIMEAPTTRSWK